MRTSDLSNTSSAATERQRALIAALTPAERLDRALAISALAREFAWAGARQRDSDRGPDAVRQRFLVQTCGGRLAAWVAERMAAEGSR